MKGTAMNDRFISELNLETLIRIKENSWNGRGSIDLRDMLTTDIDVINYRLDALGDLLDNRSFYEGIKEIIPEILSYQEFRTSSALNSDIDDLYAVKELQSYMTLNDYLHELFGKFELNSQMFRELKADIDRICSSEEYRHIKACAPENLNIVSNMQSVTIGVNLDASLRPIEAGLVSVNTEKYVSGSILDKLMRAELSETPYQCCAPLSVPGLLLSKEERQHFENIFNNALYKVLSSSLKSWRAAVRAYTSEKVGTLMRYYTDLRFLTAAADFFFRLKDMRYPVCRPKVFPMSEKKCTLKGIYSPETVLSGTHMIGNDIDFDENGMLYILSGANSGGKTVFEKSTAFCQALFQLGLYVPAEYAELSPCSELLLSFSTYDRSSSKSRFTDECEKISDIMKLADEHSMLIFDEAFSGTSSTEAAAVASEVLKAMSAKGCRGIFVTHIHELIKLPEEFNGSAHCVSKLDNLTVEVDSGSGKRLYKIKRTRPDGKSRASDIARKYGLSFEELIANRR